MIDWKEDAVKAMDDGYIPGNEWENLLRKAVDRCNPALAEEFGADYPFYLQVRTNHAQNQYLIMLEQGTPAETARELAIADLLPASDDD